MTLRRTLFLTLCAVLLTACSASHSLQQNNTKPGLVHCADAEGALQQEGTVAVLALQRSIESGPLFAIMNTVGLAECRVTHVSGLVSLEYRFRDGAILRAKQDVRIEYFEQEVQFLLPLTEDPVAILARAERASFGPEGCGINWRRSEIQSVKDISGITEMVFRGEVCNCQARIRRDAAKNVIGLMLRSAC